MKNDRMIQKRDEFALTQEEVANEVNLSQSMIARIESGDRDPGKEHKIKLAMFYGVSVEWLFYEQINDQKSLISSA